MINALKNKFDNIKQEADAGKPLLNTECELEDLLIEAVKLSMIIKKKSKCEQELYALIKEIKQYFYNIQRQIDQETSQTL